MRIALPLLSLVILTLPAAGCRRDGHGRHWELPTLMHLGEHRVSASWSQDGAEASFRLRGEATFNEAENEITFLSEGGELSLRIHKDGVTSSFEARQRGHVLQLSLDGRPVDAAQARAWLGTYLPAIFRHTGVDADRRAERILARGGAEAMAAEIHQMQNNYCKRKYLEAWLRREGGTPAAVQRMANLAGRELDSSYELATFLLDALERGPADDATRLALVQSAKGIDSDYEHHRALAAVLETGPVSEALALEVLASGGRIHSDHEKANLLHEVLEREAGARVAAAVIQSAKEIGSSYECARIAKRLADSPGLEASTHLQLIGLAQGIPSDYEKAGVLLAILDHQKLDAQARQGLLEAARGIGSDYERGRVLSAAAR